jgi:hypothetical protein
MAVPETRTYETPDQVLPFDRARMELVEARGVRVWRCTFEPGWRYTQHLDRESCPAPHAAYIAPGRSASRWTTAPRPRRGPARSW